MLRNITSTVFLFLILLTLSPLPTFSIELTEYQREINFTIQALEHCEPPHLEQRTALIKEKISSWDRVTLEGVEVKTDHQWLTSQLDALVQEEDYQKREEVVSRMIEKLKSLELALQWPELRVPDPKPPLAEILERREFSQKKSNFLLMRIVRKIAEWLDKFFARLRIDIDWNPRTLLFLKWLFYSALGVLLVTVLALLVRKIIKRVPSAIPHSARESVSIKPLRPQSSSELKMRAQEYAKRGDYRSAVRYLYLSLLIYLDEKGQIEYDSTETNSEYLRKISPDSSLYRILKTLTGIFEHCWYGLSSPSRKEYRQFLNYYQEGILAKVI